MRTLFTVVLAGFLVAGVSGCRDGPFWDRRPAAPRGLYSLTGDKRVTLYWIANTETDLDGYNVYYAVRGATGPYKFMAFTRDARYVDSDVQNGSTYWYAVSAVDENGHESELSAENIHDTPRPEGENLRVYNAAYEASRGQPYDENAIVFENFLVVSRNSGRGDVYYSSAGGRRQLVALGAATGLQDAGFTQGGLDDIDFAPKAGWVLGGAVDLVPGHTVLVWTRQDHYAKLYVRDLTDDSVVFDWAYQVDAGNRELKVSKEIRP